MKASLPTGDSSTIRNSAVGGALGTCLLAVLVGVIAGSLGSAFHYLLEKAFALHAAVAGLFPGDTGIAALATALLGAAMAGGAFALVRRFAPEAAGSGIQEIEGTLSGLRPVNWLRVIPVKFVGGVLAIGAGLVLGREGPTVHLGGCVGRMIGEKARAGRKTMNTLLAAGAAAGLSAAFGAPLASILFVTEEMRRRFHYSFLSLHAVALASITAKVVNDQVFGMGPLLPIQLNIALSKAAPVPDEIIGFVPLYLGLGVLIGVCGAAFNKILLACLRVTDRLSVRTMLVFASSLGGVAGALMVLAPGFVGGGDSLVQAVFATPATLGWLLGVLVVRSGMTFLSYSAGVPGGVFAPMLALGVLLGMSFGCLAHQVLPDLPMNPGVFALSAMGGLFAATVRAPLTGIVLVAELTSSFELLTPLIVTCLVASLTAQLIGSKPLYGLLVGRMLGNETKVTR